MKAEKFILHTEFIRENCIARINRIELDGKTMVTISNAGNKSSRQRGLQWRWYTDVAQAGIGGKHEDTKEGVHLVSKYRWAIPILIRDDPFFAEIYHAWFMRWDKDDERKMWFVDHMVHTEDFNTSQMAEFLTEFQQYYGPHVNLTDPQDRNLLKMSRTT